MIEALIYQGNLEELKKILHSNGVEDLKCNRDTEELAAIHWAANSGNIEIVKFLLDPPIIEDPNLTRMNKFTPLHSAAMVGNTSVVKLLIERGANVNAQTDPQKYAPIHSAAFAGYLETVQVLVENGADISLKNYRDELPIDTAKRQNQLEVVDYLEKLKK